MAIVLAIEPDRRQAAHLTAIVRHLVGVELVIADTTEGALDAIGNRVPELVLVPALLSPQDDAALAAALRVIATAAHVRTLTIPVLGNGATRATAGGMLAKWRRARASSPEPDGCDPSVFGEQIAAYLKEAADERAQLAEDLLGDEPFIAPAPMPRAPEPRPYTPEPELRVATPSLESELEAPDVQLFAYTEDAPTDAQLSAAVIPFAPVMTDQPFTVSADTESNSEVSADTDAEVEVDPLWSDTVAPLAVVTLAAETIEQALDDLEASPFDREEPLVDLSEELESLRDDEADSDLFDGEQVGVFTLGADDADAMHGEAAEIEVVDPPPSPRADIETWVPMSLTPGRMWPALEGMPAEIPAARTDQPDWIELVASLRQDIERRRTEPASAKPRPVAARPSDGGGEAQRIVKKPRAAVKSGQPVQDEWGFFDPEQCGFSTLLAKLEEITEDART